MLRGGWERFFIGIVSVSAELQKNNFTAQGTRELKPVCLMPAFGIHRELKMATNKINLSTREVTVH